MGYRARDLPVRRTQAAHAASKTRASVKRARAIVLSTSVEECDQQDDNRHHNQNQQQVMIAHAAGGEI